MASGGDGKFFSNLSATPTQFALLGGTYGVTATATWGGGNVVLNILSADGSTWVPAIIAIAANGFAVVNLPAGQYQLAITTATAVYMTISRIAT